MPIGSLSGIIICIAEKSLVDVMLIDPKTDIEYSVYSKICIVSELNCYPKILSALAMSLLWCPQHHLETGPKLFRPISINKTNSP